MLRLRSIPKVRPRRRLPTKSSAALGLRSGKHSTRRLDDWLARICRCRRPDRGRLLAAGVIRGGAARQLGRVRAGVEPAGHLAMVAARIPDAPARRRWRPYSRVGLVGPAARGAAARPRLLGAARWPWKLLMGAGLGGAVLVGGRSAGPGGARSSRRLPAGAAARAVRGAGLDDLRHVRVARRAYRR